MCSPSITILTVLGEATTKLWLEARSPISVSSTSSYQEPALPPFTGLLARRCQSLMRPRSTSNPAPQRLFLLARSTDQDRLAIGQPRVLTFRESRLSSLRVMSVSTGQTFLAWAFCLFSLLIAPTLSLLDLQVKRPSTSTLVIRSASTR